MKPPISLLAASLVSLLFSAAPPDARGQSPAPTRTPSLDAHGDPLPEHARSRLGTVRMRHGVPITFVDISPDNTTILGVGSDGIARVWELATGKERYHFPVPDREVDWELSPDHRTLLTSTDDDSEVRVWDAATGKRLRTLVNDGGFLSYARFAPDGKRIAAHASGGDAERGSIRFWDLATGKELRSIVPAPPTKDEKGFYPHQFWFAAGGKVLAANGSWGDKGALYLWESESGKPLSKGIVEIPQRSYGNLEPVLSPNGMVLARFQRNDKDYTITISLEDATNGKKLCDLAPAFKNPEKVTFSPDGRTVVAVEEWTNIHHWEVASGKALPAPVIHPDDRAREFAFSPDGRTLAVGTTYQGTIYLCEATTGRVLHTLQGYGPGNFELERSWGGGVQLTSFGPPEREKQTLTFSRDGKLLAAAGRCGILRVWNVADGKLLQPGPAGHEGVIWSLATSADSKLVVSAATDKTVRLWDPADPRKARSLALPVEKQGEYFLPYSVAISPDGKTAAGGSEAGLVVLWDTSTGKPRLHFDVLPMVTSLAFSPDGKKLAVGATGTILWMDAATGKQLHCFASPEVIDPETKRAADKRAIQTVAVSADGRLLAGSDNFTGQLRIWELGSGQLRHRLGLVREREVKFPHPPPVRVLELSAAFDLPFLAFASDGKSVVWVQRNNIHLWDLTHGKLARQIPLPDWGMTALAFSPTGSLLAIASHHGNVRLWDPSTGLQRGELWSDRGHFHSLAFSPDGKTLLTGGSDSTLLFWDVESILKSGQSRPRAVSSKELEELWKQLASASGRQASQAMARLQEAPQVTLPFLRQQLKPAALVEARRMEQLLADLKSDQFDVRKKATEELEQIGEQAEPLLRKHLAEEPLLEVRRRMEQLLGATSGFVNDPQRIRALRAIEVLERIGDAESRALLKQLAEGAPAAWLTREASGALERLSKPGTAAEKPR